MITRHRTGRPVPDRQRPLVPRDVAEARARVAEALRGAATSTGSPPSTTAVGDALLVTSELVTNALRHGGGLTGFGVDLDPGAVTITVADASGELPRLTGGRGTERASGPPEGGFGWPLVRLLAQEIRLTLPPGGGKTIEVRLPLR
ncbi:MULTISPECIES: ATP-binding protein [unclassified Streptomyces]|uniref:ATP-binding protein n=1 Tax=unclassified Streptomyces TaxID=2593676 RepID=UPI001E571749|nr:ATP-binding protein [Streptomyces sp. MBT42]MCD2468533.1 ATP-binding protein [Streptomyces sp. MBT42]